MKNIEPDYSEYADSFNNESVPIEYENLAEFATEAVARNRWKCSIERMVSIYDSVRTRQHLDLASPTITS